MRRIAHEPAYVLHRYAYSESSLILELFTRHHGRVAVLAKGVRRPSSNFRPVLLPLQPLHVGYGGEGEIGTLKSAEWIGGHVMPTADALLAGYCANELLMRLLARDDAHPALFDAYGITVALLAGHAAQGTPLQALMRAFELVLLRETGLLPALDVQTLSNAPLHEQALYVLRADSGLRAAHPDENFCALAGQHCLALHQAMQAPGALQAVLWLCVQQPAMARALKRQTRHLLRHHCDTPTLRTWQLMHELQLASRQ